MKVTRTSNEPVEISKLDIGAVFCLPYDQDTVYMIIDKDDVFLNKDKIGQDAIVFVELEEGGIYSALGNKEVIELNGSFVISDD